MTKRTLVVSSLRLPFWTRFAIALVAMAATGLGLLTLHSTTSHHSGVTGSHQHATTSLTGATSTAGADIAGQASGLLATCEGCALGTATGATGTALLLALLALAFIVLRRPAVFARLLDRGRPALSAVAAIPWKPAPSLILLSISISRT